MTTKELEEIKETNQQCVALVLNFFQFDGKKTKLWFETENGMLGGLAPNDLIRLGLSKKLLKFIETMLAENEA